MLDIGTYRKAVELKMDLIQRKDLLSWISLKKIRIYTNGFGNESAIQL
jgi:hypothetical protein